MRAERALRSPTLFTCIAPSHPHNTYMNGSLVDQNEQQLERQIADVRQTLEILEAQLKLIRKMKKKEHSQKIESPNQINLLEQVRIPLADAATEGMKVLGEFSKRQLYNWMRSKYPGLQFSIKSLDRVFAQSISKGKVELTKKNIGSKFPAVYQWK